MMCMQMKTRDSEEEIMGAMQRMFDAENTCVVRGRCLHNAFSHATTSHAGVQRLH